jgi:signal transduction histidine kinase
VSRACGAGIIEVVFPTPAGTVTDPAAMTESSTPAKALREENAPTELKRLVDWIAEATAPVVGADFFRSLAQLLATRMGVDTALITQCPDAAANRVETLALWHHGEFVDNFAFDLAGTPCEHVIHDGRFRFLPEGVSQRFPDWSREEGGVESFIGVPVRCPTTGDVLGHIAIYDGRPMQRGSVVESLFRIVAARAGAEIRRQQEESARRRSEALARQRLDELARISRRASMSELATGLAHELRQPLTSLTAYLQGALRRVDGSAGSETLREALEHALANAERTGAIVRQLHDWLGNAEPAFEPVAIAGLLQETADLLAPEAEGVDAVIDLQCDSDLPRVHGDAVLLQQVLVNLVRNALQAVARAAPGSRRVGIGAERHADGVRIRVRDPGDGVAEDRTEAIFAPFSSSRTGGMGVGLWLCRALIESHGGTLVLASRRDPTEFGITLPAQAAAASGPDTAAEA